MCHTVEFSCPGCAGHIGPEILPCVHQHRSVHVHHPFRRLTFDALIIRGFYRCTNAGCLLNPDIHKALMALHVAADARGATYTQAGFAYTVARVVAEGVAPAAAAPGTTTTTATSDDTKGPSPHMDVDCDDEEDEACELALPDTEEAQADEARAREARRRRHLQRKSAKTPGGATGPANKTARFADTLSVFREDGSGTVATLPVRWGPGRVRRTFGRKT